jgi:hypothetical protein
MTLPKDLLLHLGVGRGDEIEFELLPDAPAALMRGKPSKITANDPGLNTVMEWARKIMAKRRNALQKLAKWRLLSRRWVH